MKLRCTKIIFALVLTVVSICYLSLSWRSLYLNILVKAKDSMVWRHNHLPKQMLLYSRERERNSYMEWIAPEASAALSV